MAESSQQFPPIVSEPDQSSTTPLPQSTIMYATQSPQSVILVAPEAGRSLALPQHPTRYVCPSCRQVTNTQVQYKASTRTHLMALLMCSCMLICCAWIPYVAKSCKAADHYCTNCGCYIGTAKNF